jgi:hemerythrin-like domain-containing protein
MKCTELVIGDHVVLRRGLNIFEGMMKKLEDGERIEIADVKTVLKFLQAFGDEYHQTMEEKVLFPVLVRATPHGSPIHQMVLEHGEERALVTWILDAFESRRVTDFVYSSRRLILILRNHIDKEDAVLGQLAERLLSKEEDDRVVAEFTKNHKQPEMYLDFSRLERKYTPKSDRNSLDSLDEPVRGRAAASHRQ